MAGSKSKKESPKKKTQKSPEKTNGDLESIVIEENEKFNKNKKEGSGASEGDGDSLSEKITGIFEKTPSNLEFNYVEREKRKAKKNEEFSQASSVRTDEQKKIDIKYKKVTKIVSWNIFT